MKEGKKILEEIMLENLESISEDLIDQVMIQARKLIPSQRLQAISGLAPSGVREYKAQLLEAMAALATDAIDQARKEVPAAKKVKLGEFDKLPPALQKKIKTRNDLLIGKQIGDLQKVIEFAYATNEGTTDSNDQLEQDIRDSAIGWLDGTAVQLGADITAATVVNEARDAFFSDDDVADQIDAFVFVNGDPVSEICKDLAGTVFAKDDPNRFRYTPPLHWNCKSSIQVILKGNLNGREIVPLKPSTQKIEDTIQFSENQKNQACTCC